jgi:hypothetical protein
VLSLLLLSECDSELGLMVAAKYYALAAVLVIGRSDKANVRNLLPSALSALAGIEYSLGNWFDAIVSSRDGKPSFRFDGTTGA